MTGHMSAKLPALVSLTECTHLFPLSSLRRCTSPFPFVVSYWTLCPHWTSAFPDPHRIGTTLFKVLLCFPNVDRCSLLCLFCLPNSPNFTSIVFTLPSTVLLVCLFLSYEPSCSRVARHFLRFLFLFNFFAILLACLDPFSNYLLLSLFVSILTMVIAPKRSGTFSHPFMRVSYQLGFPLRGPAMCRVYHHTTGRRNYAPICLCFNIGTPASKSHMAIKTVQSCVSISIFKIFPEYPHVQYKERSVCIV